MDKNKEVKSLTTMIDEARPYLDKFNKAKTFNSSRMDSYAENMAFYQGNQHLLSKYAKSQPWVVSMNTPYASVAVDNRISSLLANDYEGTLLPLSEMDVSSVEALERIYKKEWERMNIDQRVRECIRTSGIVREAYVHIIFDKNKIIGGNGNKRFGALEAYTIDPSCIFIDPNARNLRDAKYLFIAGRVGKEEALEKYKELEEAKNSSDTFTPKERGEVYYDNDYTTEQEDVFTVLTYYGVNKRGFIDRVKLINGIIVEKKVDKDAMKIKRIPLAQMRWKKAAQSCYGLSLFDEVLSLQKAITSIESAITNTALAYAAPSMMVRKGCGVDPKIVAKANGAPGVVYAVDGSLDNAMRPVVPPKIESDIVNIKTDFQNQIDKITGNSQQFLGDIGTAGNTSSGAKMAVDRAKIIEIDVLNNIKEFIEDITSIIVDYIVALYAGETINTYDGKTEDGKYKFVDIKVPTKDELKGVQYKYYIELETKTPYSKERQKELLMEIFQIERQYDTPIKTITLSDIIKNSDIENKDEIILRFNQLNFQDATSKAESIEQLYTAGVENNVPNELLTQAIAEIVSSQKDTPAVDEVMNILEQSFQQQVNTANEKFSGAVDQLSNTPQSNQQAEMMAQQLLNQQ